MDEDQANERFDMDGDFEGGRFVDGEFVFEKRKERRARTADEVLYGVFAEAGSDSDDGGGRPRKKGGRGHFAFGGRGNGNGSKPSYAAPVGFVAAGRTTVEEQAEEKRAREAASAGPAGVGLGFRAPAVPPTDSGVPHSTPAETDSADADLPAAFGGALRTRLAARRRDAAESAVAAAAAATGATGRAPLGRGTGLRPPPVPAFESHTKGIGSKLLAKMGYTGGGLGATGTGMAKAIEVKMRAKGAGLGTGAGEAGDGGETDETAAGLTAALRAARADSAPAPAPPPSAPSALWRRRQAAERERRERTVYAAAAEIAAATGGAPSGPPASTVVLDMRGPRPTVLTDLSQLGATGEAGPAGGDEGLPFPEIQHNLRLLVSLCAARVATCDRKQRHEADTAVILAREAARLAMEADRQEAQAASAARLSAAAGALMATGAAGMAPVPTLTRLAAMAAATRAESPAAYAAAGLPAIALAAVLPSFLALLHPTVWSPLQRPGHGAAEVTAWRPLLASGGAETGDDGDDDGDHAPIFAAGIDGGGPYVTLVREAVLPAVRAALLPPPAPPGAPPRWDPKCPEPLLTWLDSWDGALPLVIRQHVLETHVLPRLAAAVEAWEPRTDPVPVHAWLHPWLPHLGSTRMASLWPTVRRKLGACLVAWHPSDGSAQAMLSPWKAVFAPRDWDGLMARCILPPLGRALSALAIHPGNQDLDPISWALSWTQHVGESVIARLLESAFFPRWLAALRAWLAAPGSDYDEVARWYSGWRALIPPDLQAHAGVRRAMAAALGLMAAAAEDPEAFAASPPPLPTVSDSRDAATRDAGGKDAAGTAPPAPSTAEDGAEVRFQDLVASYAAAADIALAPKPGRQHEGHAVWAFGAVSVILDAARQSVRAQVAGGAWEAVSLEQVVAMHRARAAQRTSGPGR